MKYFRAVIVTIAVSVFCFGCAELPRTTKLPLEPPFPDRKKYTCSSGGDKTVFVTFSGGGMRAAALSYGVLKELKYQKINKKNNEKAQYLIDEVDLVSSVSGGSVTAAYWALKGSNFDRAIQRADGSGDERGYFVEHFLKRNITSSMLAKGIPTLPWTLFSNNRIDLLVEHLEDLYEGATYETLIPNASDDIKRPCLVVNATDLEARYTFSFTQDQFNLICADLNKMRLADAVAASAAYPVILSALTLKNYSPCGATIKPEWIAKNEHKKYGQDPRAALRSRRALELFNNEDEKRNYIHLFDGGFVDNLGLSLPLTLINDGWGAESGSGAGSSAVFVPYSDISFLNSNPLGSKFESISNKNDEDKVKDYAVIMVNARTQPDKHYGKSRTPPGITSAVSTIKSLFGAAKYNTSLLLTKKINRVAPTIEVTFDSITDSDCRRRFQNIPTSWDLSDNEIEALITMGRALLRESPRYGEVVKDLNGDKNTDEMYTIKRACEVLE